MPCIVLYSPVQSYRIIYSSAECYIVLNIVLCRVVLCSHVSSCIVLHRHSERRSLPYTEYTLFTHDTSFDKNNNLKSTTTQLNLTYHVLSLTLKWLYAPTHPSLPPTQTQWQNYLSCYWHNFDQMLKKS